MLQPTQFHEQLRMFMPAGELHAIVPGDASLYPSLSPEQRQRHINDTWTRKSEENHDFDGDFQASIDKFGVRVPVEVMHGTSYDEMYEGHHRVQAAFEKDPDELVPVIHHSPTARGIGY